MFRIEQLVTPEQMSMNMTHCKRNDYEYGPAKKENGMREKKIDLAMCVAPCKITPNDQDPKVHVKK